LQETTNRSILAPMSTGARLSFTSSREPTPASERCRSGVVLGLASLMLVTGCGSSGSAGTGGSGNLGGKGGSGARGGNAASTGGVTGTGGAASTGGASSGGAAGPGGVMGSGGASAGGAGGVPVATGGTSLGGRGGAPGGRGGATSPGGQAGSAAGSSGSAGSSAGGRAGQGGKSGKGGQGGQAGQAGQDGKAGSPGGAGGTKGSGGQGAGCTFPMSYDIFTTQAGGRYLRATLSPPASFAVEMLEFGNTFLLAKCAPPLPACQTAAAIDASDFIAAMANADVKRALGQLVTHYAPVSDGPMLTVGRYSDSHEIIETLPCNFDCTTAPEGVRALLTLARNLLAQQLADPTCKDITNPDGGLPPFPIARNPGN
jgi:hypothetical protein